LFCAVLVPNKNTFDIVADLLSRNFGKIILKHPPEIFEHTNYYATEMGDKLYKGFLAFDPPFYPDQVSHAKLKCRKIEWASARMTHNTTQRMVNIDPGIVTLANVILATSKNFSHRIFLRNGIYAEVTLIFQRNEWKILPWTYPDYQIKSSRIFLLECRQKLKEYIDRKNA